jgi:tRNA modification GTPase
MSQLKCGISNEISILRNDLLNFASLVELELDFAEEDVEFADRTALTQLLNKIEFKLKSLIDSFQYGNAIKSGVAVAIIGKPNAGKSTLLNALLKEERAIVSEIAGTTRDTIEEILHIKGNAFRLIDTAGLRETEDTIEAIGVVKAKEKVAHADILVYLIDANTKDLSEDVAMLNELMRVDMKTIVCITKSELSQSNIALKENIVRNFQHLTSDLQLMEISAKDNIHLQELKDEFSNYVENLKTTESNVVITNQRHYEALQKSIEAVYKVKDAITHQISTELLAYELRNSLEYLGEISGEFTNDELLGNIFSKFCIGK